MSAKTVLITGCSSGIGLATAQRLSRRGWNVYASARDPLPLKAFETASFHPIALDITDEVSTKSAVEIITAAEGYIGVLINNAGYSQSGALETLPLSLVRKQFETNVFGLLRLCQLVLPGMRGGGKGKIVNMSSVGGKLTFPGGGAYHASKHAVEALSDALRFEVRPFGVDVIIMEPGLIRTRFADAVHSSLAGLLKIPVYDRFNELVGQTTKDVYEKGVLALLGGGPEAVAKKIEHAITVRSPRARYSVTASAKVLLGQRRWMSDAMWDGFLRGNFPQPGAE